MPLLLVLFIGSGCAALIYEIVWFQLLQLVIGSSAVSMGVLLGTFMGGMCLGSLLLPRLISTKEHPLQRSTRCSNSASASSACCCSLRCRSSAASIRVGRLGRRRHFVRGIVAAICLLPPTLLMGATLPAIARWVETTPEGRVLAGLLLRRQHAGAVVGSLLAGFYLLRVFDMCDRRPTWPSR